MNTEVLFGAVERLLAEKERIVVALEGPSASGKSTLACVLKERWDAAVIPMDDFFLPAARKTPARLAEPGGNVDYERFIEEVVPSLGRGEFFYRPFSCRSGALNAPVLVPSRRLTVVEGVYSLHPKICFSYDLRIFLEISPEEQSRRILLRNGEEMGRRFAREWIPMENRYFQTFSVKEACDLFLTDKQRSV